MPDDRKLVAFLSQYLSDSRRKQIEERLSSRTRYLTLILEDIYNPHNANAVVRSCECFGIQDMHVVEERNVYDLSPKVLQGSYKWVNLIRYNNEKRKNIKECYKQVRKRGYRIVATSPNANGTPIAEIDISQPIALVFGTELEGLTDWALENADETAFIPMVGFTESFNISVGAALCMYELMNRIRNSDVDWQLKDRDKDEVRLHWYRNSINRVELLESEFHRRL